MTRCSSAWLRWSKAEKAQDAGEHGGDGENGGGNAHIPRLLPLQFALALLPRPFNGFALVTGGQAD